MPAVETKQLLRAIEDFTDAYGADESFADVIEGLNGVAEQVREHAGGEDDQSPGREAARKAVEDEREKPRALRDAAEPKEKGKAPSSYAEATERARERFQGRDESSARAGGSDAPGTARETA